MLSGKIPKFLVKKIIAALQLSQQMHNLLTTNMIAALQLM
jgi:hypothetical protein